MQQQTMRAHRERCSREQWLRPRGDSHDPSLAYADPTASEKQAGSSGRARHRSTACRVRSTEPPSSTMRPWPPEAGQARRGAGARIDEDEQPRSPTFKPDCRDLVRAACTTHGRKLVPRPAAGRHHLPGVLDGLGYLQHLERAMPIVQQTRSACRSAGSRPPMQSNSA